jgi:hypothetical protein
MTIRTTKEVLAVVEALKARVEDIEASIATTQNHYGDYMGLLMKFADDAGQRKVLAHALVLAGANKQGVADALRAAS